MWSDEELAFFQWLNTADGADWFTNVYVAPEPEPVLSLGEPAGNPGYSFAAPTYSTQHYDAATGQVTGGYNDGPITEAGAIWVGEEGGDTAENRALFEDYLLNSTIIGSNATGYSPNYLTPPTTQVVAPASTTTTTATTTTAPPSATTTDTTAPHVYTQEELDFLTSLNTPEGAAAFQPYADAQKLYQGLFGRNADQAGLEFWANTGLTGDDLAMAMLDSASKDDLLGYYNRIYEGTFTDDSGRLIGYDDTGKHTVLFNADGTTPMQTVETLQSGLVRGESNFDDAIEWWNATNDLYNGNPEEFNRWAYENPEWAVRYFARAGLEDVNVDVNRDGTIDRADNQTARDLAAQYGYLEAQNLGFGEDGTQNGQTIATGYNDGFKDINNEYGIGDFWKIGTASTAGEDWDKPDQLLANPIAHIIANVLLPYGGGEAILQLAQAGYGDEIGLEDIAQVAMAAIPRMVPGFQELTGITDPLIAKAALTAAVTGVQTGEIDAALQSFATGYAGNWIANEGVNIAGVDIGGGGRSVITGALQGGTNELIDQAFNGDFDLNDILTGAAWGGGTVAIQDVIQDTFQTASMDRVANEEAVKRGYTDYDDFLASNPTQQELADFDTTVNLNFQSTDVGKLFGQEGDLNNLFGVGGDFLDTEILQNILTTVGDVGATILSPLFYLADKTGLSDIVGAGVDWVALQHADPEIKARLEAVDADQAALRELSDSYYAGTSGLSAAEFKQQYDDLTFGIQTGIDTLKQDVVRYDERFSTGSDQERGDIDLHGIYNENPYDAQNALIKAILSGSGNTTTTGTNTTLPTAPTGPTIPSGTTTTNTTGTTGTTGTTSGEVVLPSAETGEDNWLQKLIDALRNQDQTQTGTESGQGKGDIPNPMDGILTGINEPFPVTRDDSVPTTVDPNGTNTQAEQGVPAVQDPLTGGWSNPVNGDPVVPTTDPDTGEEVIPKFDPVTGEEVIPPTTPTGIEGELPTGTEGELPTGTEGELPKVEGELPKVEGEIPKTDTEIVPTTPTPPPPPPPPPPPGGEGEIPETDIPKTETELPDEPTGEPIPEDEWAGMLGAGGAAVPGKAKDKGPIDPFDFGQRFLYPSRDAQPGAAQVGVGNGGRKSNKPLPSAQEQARLRRILIQGRK